MKLKERTNCFKTPYGPINTGSEKRKDIYKLARKHEKVGF